MKLEKTYTGNYKNVDFVLGSAAEVERLWSVARYVITDLRSRLSPVMFEALLFLKVNKDYWDKYLVAEAIKLVTSAKYEEKLKRLNEQEETTLNEENWYHTKIIIIIYTGKKLKTWELHMKKKQIQEEEKKTNKH